MGFLGVRAGSYIIKNMNEFLNILKKVDQCSTFEEGKENSIRSCEKKVLLPRLFFDLWAVRAASKKH
jgi:hypothetical protein